MNGNFKKSPNGSHECCTLISLPIIQQHRELLMITVNYPARGAIYFLSFLFFSLFLGGAVLVFLCSQRARNDHTANMALI